MKRVLEFYETVVSCENSDKNCPNTVNNLNSGNPPRGFYTEGKPKDIVLLLVAKNPGHPLKEEQKMYCQLPPREIVQTHIEFIRNIFQRHHTFGSSDRRSLTFHKNLFRYMSYFLDIPEDEVFQQCAYTNLVKCSSIGERDNLRIATMRECFQNHLVREIELFNPNAIIAFGREVYNFLSRDAVKRLHLKPVVYIKHPSYYYRKDQEPKILAGLKSEIAQHLS